eukprot:scaffold591_cov174-Ochromonas_danica.AAC.5
MTAGREHNSSYLSFLIFLVVLVLFLYLLQAVLSYLLSFFLSSSSPPSSSSTNPIPSRSTLSSSKKRRVQNVLLDPHVPITLETARRRYDVLRVTKGANHEETLKAARELGSIFLQVNRYKEAIEVFDNFAKRMESIFGPFHPKTLEFEALARKARQQELINYDSGKEEEEEEDLSDLKTD